MTQTREANIPKALADELAANKVPADWVEDVVCEASPRCPWIVSVNRQASRKAQPYATVRPSSVRYFDTFDEALKDAGGQDAQEGTGNYYEFVDAADKSRGDIPFTPPITFVGQVGDLLFLTAPPGQLLAGQAVGLKTAANACLTAATKDGKIPRDAKLQMLMVPAGVRLGMMKVVERK